MSNISSNSLFHFTPLKKYLLGILEKEFLPKFCYEEITLKTDSMRPVVVNAIPMVCFCDISLSQIQKHIEEYGDYGIGMTKEWGIRNKLNPIVYVNPDSFIANSFHSILMNMSELLNGKCNQSLKDANDELMSLMNFLKPYEGYSKKNPEKHVRFYNEKEWRYVPDLPFEERIFFSPSEFRNKDLIASKNREMESHKLSFSINDIKYIFLKSNNEIHDFIQDIRKIKGPRYSPEEVDILTTKIFTVENLKDDF
jgi:hypothetical protein